MKKEKKQEPKRYEIDSLEKLVNVATLENIDRLVTDFKSWLRFAIRLLEEVRKKHPEETKGKANSEIYQCWFTWIDDGKNDLKFVKIVDRHTGEITTFETPTTP